MLVGGGGTEVTADKTGASEETAGDWISLRAEETGTEETGSSCPIVSHSPRGGLAASLTIPRGGGQAAARALRATARRAAARQVLRCSLPLPTRPRLELLDGHRGHR